MDVSNCTVLRPGVEVSADRAKESKGKKKMGKGMTDVSTPKPLGTH